MKNKEKTKPTKKKIVMYYLILAACLLVIAGVTVGIVYAVRGNNPVTPPIIDNNDGNKPGDDGNKPGDDDNKDPDDGENKPNKPANTESKYEFIVPVKVVNLSQAHVFAHDKTLDRYCLHEGMDFKCAAGTEVLAAVDGTVTSVNYRDELYGAVIEIEHADGVKTVYRFIDPAENIKKGDVISRGDVIGTVATATGVENAEGDHLHFEVYKNNIMQDPDDYLNIISK